MYEPQITSFGLNKSNIIWEFTKTKEKNIFGNKTLLLIIRTAKGAKIKGKFVLGAEISSLLSKWLPIPVRNTDESLVDIEYDLSE